MRKGDCVHCAYLQAGSWETSPASSVLMALCHFVGCLTHSCASIAPDAVFSAATVAVLPLYTLMVGFPRARLVMPRDHKIHLVFCLHALRSTA